MTSKLKLFAFPYLLWMAIFIIVPLLLLTMYAFTSNEMGNLDGAVFTFQNFIDAFKSTNLKAVSRSFEIAIKTTIICLLIGYPVAYIISKLKITAKTTLLLLFIMPMWINMLLRIYAWKNIMLPTGMFSFVFEWYEKIFNTPLELLNTEKGILIGMVYNFLPFMIFPIFTVLDKMNKDYIEASRDLGANSFWTFVKVILPLSIPGIVTGIVMVFMPAMSTFIIPQYLGGGKYDYIGTIIERQFMGSGRNWGLGSALAFLLMILILVSIWFTQKSDKKRGKSNVKKIA